MRFFLKLTAIAIVMAVSSCVTQQKCLEKFPPKPYDSVVTVITYKDTVIRDTVVVPGKGLTIHDTLPCPELNYHKEVKKDGLTHTVNITKGVLKSDCIADSLILVIDNLVKQKQTLILEKRKEVSVVKVNELTKGQGFLIVCGWLFWICLLIGIIYIILRIYFRK